MKTLVVNKFLDICPIGKHSFINLSQVFDFLITEHLIKFFRQQLLVNVLHWIFGLFSDQGVVININSDKVWQRFYLSLFKIERDLLNSLSSVPVKRIQKNSWRQTFRSQRLFCFI